jgi:RND family efflux transporter MFP subunit
MASEPIISHKPSVPSSDPTEGNGHGAPAAHGAPAHGAPTHGSPPNGSPPNGAGHAARQQPAAHGARVNDEIGAPPAAPHPSRFALLLLAGCTLAVLAALFFFGLLPRLHEENVLAENAEQITTALPRVSVGSPKQSAAIVEVQLPGNVEALQETTVYPRTSGYLKNWLVDIGDDVKAGQLLAVIDTPDVDQQLDKAKATLSQLRAQQIRAESDLRLADTTLVRYQSLDRDNAVSKLELDQRRSAAETARSALAAAQANVVGGQADVDRLTTLQDFSRVYAPFAGTITARNIEVGQLLTDGNGASQSLFHIAKTNPVRVFVNVPQIYSPGVKVGLEAELVVREMPHRKFVGKVTRTARALDPATRTLLTEIEVPNDDRALLTNAYVQVRMRVARDDPPLLIPPAALVYNADGTRVAVLDSSAHVHFQPVEVEGDFGSEVGISSGLTAQDRIVTNPGARLADGEAVQVDAPKAADKAEPIAKSDSH